MGDAENAIPPSKKRAAGRELSRDNPGLDDDDEDVSEQETGTFKRASEEVLATRRIVKVRRPPTTTSTPTSNPFSGIQLIPTSTQSASNPSEASIDVQATSEKTVFGDGTGEDVANKETENGKDKHDKQPESKIDGSETESSAPKDNVEAEEENGENKQPVGENKTENEDKKEDPVGEDKKENEEKEEDPIGEDKTENEDKKEEEKGSAPLNSFQQLSSSQNAFTGIVGTGFSTSIFSFGAIPKDGSSVGTTSLGLSNNNGNSTLFGTALGTSIVSKSEASNFPSMQEVSVETGEEHEKVIFAADSILFEFIDGGWKERGKGELKVNVSTTGTKKARLLMRAKGNYRLILNASIYPDMKLTNMDKKGITFACVNSTGEVKEGLSTVALKFKDVSIVEEFRSAVLAHKCKTSSSSSSMFLKTPENSPKASED